MIIRYIIGLILAIETIAHTNYAQQPQGMTVLNFMQTENNIDKEAKEKACKEALEIQTVIERLQKAISEPGYDALCHILLETIILYEKGAESINKKLCTKLLFQALEHGHITTFNKLLTLPNADPNAIDSITQHTLPYMAVKFNNPVGLTLLAVAYHAKLETKGKEYYVTPRYLARTNSYKQCTQILQAAGARE